MTGETAKRDPDRGRETGPAGVRRIPAICAAVVALYAVFLAVELWLGGAWDLPGETISNVVTLVVCLLPSLGLSALASTTTGAFRAIACGVLVLGTAAGAALIVYALHLAQPDAQNAIVVAVVVIAQLALFLATAAAILIRRLVRRQR